MPLEFELNNGVRIPALGLGVFQAPPNETVAAVESALQIGYRHIDTAATYLNERQVGEGLHRSGLDRGEVFVETKVWVSDYGYEATLRAFQKSRAKLQTDYIDLLLLHQPVPEIFDRTVSAYRALEHLLRDGHVRAIGISNFTPSLLDRLLDQVDVVPAVNQVELHPYFSQPETQLANSAHGILTQAWSPIGGITFYPGYGTDRVSTLNEPVIQEIGDKYGKTPAQTMLRWHIQQGRSAIPKSTNPSRIVENLNVFDFALTSDELHRIDRLDRGVRVGPDPEVSRPGLFDIVIPDA